MSDSLLFVADFIKHAQICGYSPTGAELALLKMAKEVEKARPKACPGKNPLLEVPK